MRSILTHAAALYVGAGLSLGLVMSKVLPLTAIGIAVYTATWPISVYCARPDAGCFAQMHEIVPLWLGTLMFDLEDAQ